MTTIVSGTTENLIVEWFEFAGGPASNVVGVTVTITPIAGGLAIIGPTSVGVTNPAIGVDVYPWAVPLGQAAGDYLVTWDGTDPESDLVTASEIVTVVSGLMTSPVGPCGEWTPTWTCALPLGATAVTGAAVQVATEVLYALSGRRFGLCTVTLRPCRRVCYGDTWPGMWTEFTSALGGLTSALIGGLWYNLCGASCASGCSCAPISEVVFPRPIHDVINVRVDGVTLVKDVDYRLDDFRRLVRLGGHTWPWCNDLNLADTQVGTWSVTARLGEDVPPLGSVALGVLATELTKLLMCDVTCALPQPVQSIARQGVNITFLDPNEVFASGRTGLYVPDLFIQTYNPAGLARSARVYDVDAYDMIRSLGTG